jgi:hypothetical protein
MDPTMGRRAYKVRGREGHALDSHSHSRSLTLSPSSSSPSECDLHQQPARSWHRRKRLCGHPRAAGLHWKAGAQECQPQPLREGTGERACRLGASSLSLGTSALPCTPATPSMFPLLTYLPPLLLVPRLMTLSLCGTTWAPSWSSRLAMTTAGKGPLGTWSKWTSWTPRRDRWALYLGSLQAWGFELGLCCQLRPTLPPTPPSLPSPSQSSSTIPAHVHQAFYFDANSWIGAEPGQQLELRLPALLQNPRAHRTAYMVRCKRGAYAALCGRGRR